MATAGDVGRAANTQAMPCWPIVRNGKPRKQLTRADLKREPVQAACLDQSLEHMKQTTVIQNVYTKQQESTSMEEHLRHACTEPELSDSAPLSGLSMVKTEDDDIDGLTARIMAEASTGAALGFDDDFSDFKCTNVDDSAFAPDGLPDTLKLEGGDSCASFCENPVTSQFTMRGGSVKATDDYLPVFHEAAETLSSTEIPGDIGGGNGPEKRGGKASQAPGGESQGCTLPEIVKKEAEEVIGDTGISHGMVVDADNNCSHADTSGHDILSWPDSTLDFSLESLGGGEVHDLELMDDEALLLADGAQEQEVRQRRDSAEENAGPVSEESFIEASGRQTGDEETGAGSGKGSKVATGRRKMKVDWTPELHRRFVQAVEQLGVEKAIPSRILELMGVQCLTRHNIASHLQKYRSHRRHLMAREAEAANWHSRRTVDTSSWSRMRRDGTSWVAPHTNPPPIQPRPAMGIPPLQPHPHPPPVGHPVPHPHPCAPQHAGMHPGAPAMGMPLYVWGHPTVDHSPAHMWQQPPMPPPPAWYAPDGSMWQYPVAPMDAWGHPSSAVPGTPCFPQPMMRLPSAPPVVCGTPAAPPLTAAESHHLASACTPDMFLNDEALNDPPYAFPDDLDLVIDPNDDLLTLDDETSSKSILEEAISKALADPQTPLPLGLKPPSMEKVMAELQKQGIATAPSVSSICHLESHDFLSTDIPSAPSPEPSLQ